MLLALCVAMPAAAQQPTGIVQLGRFRSAALGVQRNYFVYLPPSYRSSPHQHFPVVYLLHGYAGDEAEWITHGDIAVVADSLIASGTTPFILVLPDGDRGYWVNWTHSPTYDECAANGELSESAESGCARRWNYGDYIADDLVQHVDGTYRTIAGREGRGIMGLSMGGTGALLLALTSSKLFGAAASLSAVAVPLATTDGACDAGVRSAPTFDAFEAGRGSPSPKWRELWGTDTSAWWRHDPERAARHLRVAGGAAPALRLEVGRDDPLAGGNCTLDASLTLLGIPHQFLLWDGAHDWQAWRAHEGATLAWVVSRLSRDPDRASAKARNDH